MKSFLLTLAVACAMAPAALAEQKCSADVTHRYGETRASFSDVLAGCDDKSGACYVSASQIDKTLPANFRYQMRLVQPAGGGKLAMKLTAVEPMADIGKPLQLVWGTTKVDLTNGVETRENVVNDYWVKDAALADKTARELTAKAKVVRWTFTSDKGDPVEAALPVGGAAKALEWIACMAKGQ